MPNFQVVFFEPIDILMVIKYQCQRWAGLTMGRIFNSLLIITFILRLGNRLVACDGDDFAFSDFINADAAKRYILV